MLLHKEVCHENVMEALYDWTEEETIFFFTSNESEKYSLSFLLNLQNNSNQNSQKSD